MWKRRQSLVDMQGIPRMAEGAPLPAVIAHEHAVSLLFYLHVDEPDWDGTTVRVVNREGAREPVAVVRFNGPFWHRLGPPNEEAIAGHALAPLGFHPYAAKEVLNSDTIAAFCKANRVHPSHRDEMFAGHRHFAIAFHDTVFEAIAHGYDVEVLAPMAMTGAAAREVARWTA